MTHETLPTRPLPEPTPESQPFWDGLREHRLRFQQCAACGQLRHYPRPLCDRCYSAEIRWQESSGHGRIHSWTVAHHAFHPAFKRATPYALVTVELDDGVRMNAPWRGELATLKLEQPVQIVFEDIAEGLTLPACQPA